MSDDLFERRQAERRYALNFLDYEVLSATGEVLGRGLARTLNVSENGLRLETGQFFEPGQQLRITLGLDNDLIQVNGQVSVLNRRPMIFAPAASCLLNLTKQTAAPTRNILKL